MDVESTVGDFIVKELLFEEQGAVLDHGENLFTRRAIDSMGMLRLLAFLEKTFGVQILDEDMVPENLETVRSIAALVRRKQATAGRP